MLYHPDPNKWPWGQGHKKIDVKALEAKHDSGAVLWELLSLFHHLDMTKIMLKKM